jgi:hypothetical protein
MSPIDERLRALDIVLPDVMPPVVDGYVPAFAPFVRSGPRRTLTNHDLTQVDREATPISALRSRMLQTPTKHWKRARPPAPPS